MRSTFLLLIVSIFIFSCEPSKKVPPKYASAIQAGHMLLDSLQQNGKIPGIDIAVGIKGEIVWSEGFGFADLEHEAPIIPGKTRFRIGSVSKPITAAGLGILIDRGSLDISKPVQDYVSYFPEKKYPLTVKQVAGHIGGIRHYRNQEFLMSEHYSTIESGIEIFRKDTLLFEPGTDYSYSSYGYNLVSAVLEGASGEDFLDFMQQEVFDVLNMQLTVADQNDSIIVHRTSFYAIDQNEIVKNAPYVDNSYKWAGGGFLSTTTDLVKFGTAHMAAGFLTDATLTEFTTSQALNNGESTGYGVGWSVNGEGEIPGYGHGGGSVGGITSFKVYPEHGMVIVILSNSSNTRYGDIPGKLAQIFAQVQNQ